MERYCLSCLFSSFRTVLRTVSSSDAAMLNAASIEHPMCGGERGRIPVSWSSFPLSWRGGISMFIERCVIEWCVWELGDRNQGVWNVGSQSGCVE